MRRNDKLFSVASSADLGMTAIYLDSVGASHIELGHRDLRSFYMGIEHVVKEPTAVHLDKSRNDRFLFMSQNVVTGGGRPVVVVVERERDQGKIITATPK